MYHPKSLVNYQRQILSQCEHENCKKKCLINEYPCCHKGPHADGCMMNDGKHIMYIDALSTNQEK